MNRSPSPVSLIGSSNLLAALMFTLGAGTSPPTPTELFVDARLGDDEAADGSKDRPFRTLTRSLQHVRTQLDGPVRLRVAFGRHDRELGEVFPLELPPEVHLLGAGSGSVEIRGNQDPVLLKISEVGSGISVAGLRLSGASDGLLIERAGGRDAVVRLHDLLFDELQTGCQIRLGHAEEGIPAPLRISADGIRARRCEAGTAVSGSSPLTLDLIDSVFDHCAVGLYLETDQNERRGATQARPTDPDQGAPRRVHHTLTATGVRFEGCSVAGVLRVGSDGGNRGAPYRFEDCVFVRNQVGLELRRPCGDSALVIRRSRFLENTHFGVRVTGYAGEDSGPSLIEDCELRWNGVGVHLTSSQIPYHFRRNRVVDNAGNGLYVANILTPPTVVYIYDNLIAHNGAAGIYALADNREFQLRIAHNTIVFNQASGIRNHERHLGESHFEIRGNILFGNQPDLDRFGPDGISCNLIGDGFVCGQNGNFQADPSFLSVLDRNYALRPDSPAIDRGDNSAADIPGQHDLLGAPRRSGAPDLGAFEFHPQ